LPLMWFIAPMRNGPLEVTLLALILLAGCGQGDGNGSAGSAPAKSLTGLYEGGTGPRRDQLCLIEKDGRSSFGFVRWGPGDRNCSGSGPALREGDRLRLVLDGDASCTIEARIDGSRISFPSSLGGECRRYYCGDGADLAGAEFARTGATEADPRRAVGARRITLR
jgi:hypothetical protein